jgi:two-component system, chemotaxis family, chemotaxis protein CheY
MILIVDDSDYMRESVNLAISLLDLETVSAVDGKEALEIFQKNKPKLIITDINMPEMDGLTLITEIRKIDTDIPIIVLTTESEDDIQKKAMGLGADAWIVKPFKGKQLLAMVKELLG